MFAAGTKKSVMPNPDKTFGWYMHQKTPYKFNTGKCQFFPLSFIPVILDRKSNIFIVHTDDTVIADGNPMGIFSKVINHRLCTVKSFLAARNPFCIITGIHQLFESIMITIFFCTSMELKLICIPEIFQLIHIFPAEDFRDSPYGKKKLRTIVFPLVFRCQTTAKQYCMDMWMKVHFSSPCMQDADVTNRSAKVL
ncbi:hypothetical protein BN3589_00001 [Clostridium sp. C105KSO14]|nr:hypothetical protein BN3589_00001 [Clostridium sp. C105KSO14]